MYLGEFGRNNRSPKGKLRQDIDKTSVQAVVDVAFVRTGVVGIAFVRGVWLEEGVENEGIITLSSIKKRHMR